MQPGAAQQLAVVAEKSSSSPSSSSPSSSGGGVDFGDVRVREYLEEEVEVNRSFLHMGTRITGLDYLLKVCVFSSASLFPGELSLIRVSFIYFFVRRSPRTLQMFPITR